MRKENTMATKKQTKLVGTATKEPLSERVVSAFLKANPTATIQLTGGPSPLTKPSGKRFEIFGLMANWDQPAVKFVQDKRVTDRGGGVGDLTNALNGKPRDGYAPFIELVA